jgi:hypothetical protein
VVEGEKVESAVRRLQRFMHDRRLCLGGFFRHGHAGWSARWGRDR